MNSKSQYKTRQKDTLQEYLQSIPHRHFTIADVCDHFSAQGRPIGQTTVYRQIEKMVDEGKVNKYTFEGNSAACFEYKGDECQSAAGQCFHCKCEKCGKLIHLHCADLTNVEKHLLEHDHFVLDVRRTVFYGLCDQCAAL
ncbi:MAG: transcriptional repressor [Erysipelotrichaceae bacterium]|nr:transcriptional repressor [Erysipelotrichaceae bacterium]